MRHAYRMKATASDVLFFTASSLESAYLQVHHDIIVEIPE
jgi:hypothetical protein